MIKTIKGNVLDIEIWKPVVDYESSYEVSSFGRVRGIDRTIKTKSGYTISAKQKILTPCLNNKGYLKVCLSKNNTTKLHSVHRLVALSFIFTENINLHINHKDCDKQNNHHSNLEWVTIKENVHHAIQNNLRPSFVGAKNKTSKGDILVFKNGLFQFVINGNADMLSHGLTPSCVSRCMTGKLKQHKGYTFSRDH